MAEDQQKQQTLVDTDGVDLASSNTSCRILVVSSSKVQATTLIRRIQVLGGLSGAQAEEAIQVHSEKKDLLSPDLVKIPWTIENKYYSADVHFAVHPVRGLAPYLLQNAPAVLFVWGTNEAYKRNIEGISRVLGDHEPDVSLAVRVSSSPDVTPEEPADEDEREEENPSIDDFVSRFGFEYVDATLDVSNRREERQYEEGEFDGIPNIPRVLDALSTIMWPSMKRQEKNVNQGKGLAQHDPTMFEWEVGDGMDRSLSVVNDLAADPSSRLSGRGTRIQNEMDELTRWLENDIRDGGREDPWGMAVPLNASPPEDMFTDEVRTADTRTRDQEQTGSSERLNFAKFDDDFTVFVSAPVLEEPCRESGQSTPVGDEQEEQDGLRPPGGLATYNSLGSVSDFGGSDGGQERRVISDDEDEELPSRDEILETSSKIFGPNFKASPTADPQNPPKPSFHEEIESEFDRDDEYDMARFDLSRVLGALQQMKEEIAGMENEDARRKAAARVALGVVYGLEAEGSF